MLPAAVQRPAFPLEARDPFLLSRRHALRSSQPQSPGVRNRPELRCDDKGQPLARTLLNRPETLDEIGAHRQHEKGRNPNDDARLAPIRSTPPEREVAGSIPAGRIAATACRQRHLGLLKRFMSAETDLYLSCYGPLGVVHRDGNTSRRRRTSRSRRAQLPPVLMCASSGPLPPRAGLVQGGPLIGRAEASLDRTIKPRSWGEPAWE
jgi:hypothetical protein